MSDQAENAVENADEALLNALSEDQPQDEELKQEEEPQEDQAQPESTEEEPQKFKLTVKNDAGEDEEREFTLEELAKGQMLHADYTRKTQELARERDQVRQEAHQEIAKAQQSAVEQISQLQELVIRQAAPELEGVNWVALSIEDPARFVQLQAKQQQLNNTFQALEAQKQQLQQQAQESQQKALEQALRHSDELLSKSIKDFDAGKAQKLLTDVEKAVGWKPADLQAAARALAKEGMPPDTLGKVLLLAHEAIQFRALNAAKPEAIKKVANAPKVIKPSAPQPKRTNQAALDRLKKSGRVEDLAAFL